MEVNKSYIQFLLQLLNNDEDIDIEKNQEGKWKMTCGKARHGWRGLFKV